MMENKKYISPDFGVILINFEGMLCSSIGGNTGYDDIIGGGTLEGEDDF